MPRDEDGGISVLPQGEDVVLSSVVFAGGLLSGIRNSPGARRCSRRSAGNTLGAGHPVTGVDLIGVTTKTAIPHRVHGVSQAAALSGPLGGQNYSSPIRLISLRPH